MADANASASAAFDLRPWLDHPIALPMLVGAAFRVAAAWTGHGFFASDDYTHVIEMAWRWLDDPTLEFNSRIRSELMARCVWAIFLGCKALGIRDPATLLHSLYTLLGLYSVIAIPAVHRLTLSRFGESTARTAAWLMAAEAALPRLSTRALISMASIPPLVWGLVFVNRAHERSAGGYGDAALGAGLMSVAALFRFQLGLWFIAVLGVMAWKRARSGSGVLPLICASLAGGAVGVLGQVALDYHAFGSPVPAPYLYVLFNLENASSYGVAPWYSYFGMFLLLTLPPATVALAPGLWRAARSYPLLSIPFVVFFSLHSLVPHKEERFLFPLIPIFFVLLAVGLADAWRGKRWQRGFVRYYWIANAILLVGATVSDAHRNVTTPILEAGQSEELEAFYKIGGSLMPVFYLGDSGIRGEKVRSLDLLEQRWKKNEPEGWARILFAKTPKDEDLDRLRRLAVECRDPYLSHSDLVDQLVVWVNPEGNKRRRPKTVIDCRLGTTK